MARGRELITETEDECKRDKIKSSIIEYEKKKTSRRIKIRAESDERNRMKKEY